MSGNGHSKQRTKGSGSSHRPNPFQTCTTYTGPVPKAPKDVLAAGGDVFKLPTCPRNKASTYMLRFRAQRSLHIPLPAIRTAPPRGKRELVGIPTWFWLDKTQWAERSATAKAGGLSATVTASAYRIVVDPGDGSDSFICGAPWTPYVDGATSDCTHAYSHSGRYTVTVTADWAADWAGSDGNGGTLPTIGRTMRFGVRVVQARSELIANP